MIFAHIGSILGGTLIVDLFEETGPKSCRQRASVETHAVELVTEGDETRILIGGLKMWCDDLTVDDRINTIPVAPGHVFLVPCAEDEE